MTIEHQAPCTQPIPCPCCNAFATNPLCGSYLMSCVQCCARLVLSGRPLRSHQEGMLAVIQRRSGRPIKADVLQALKAMDAR